MPDDSRFHPPAESAVAPVAAEGTMLAAALEYAAAGLPVFPCADKRPLIRDWPSEASVDPVRLREWWTRWPQAMIGLPTGARSGLYVVDIDVRDKVDGMAAYRALKVPPATVSAWTPSGGGHVYFRWPGEGWCNTVGAIADGIDTRGEGGYVIAPPSMAANGAYRWVADGMKQRLLAGQVSELPEVLRLRVDPVRGAPAAPAPHAPADRWAAAAMDQEVARVLSAPEGSRNHTLNRAAFSLGQIVGGGRLARGEVEDRLLVAAIRAGPPEHEARATITLRSRGGACRAARAEGRRRRRASRPRRRTSSRSRT